MKMNWKGDQVVANVLAAAASAVDETTDAAARDSRGDAPSGSKDNIRSERTQVRGATVVGRWGVFNHPRWRYIVAVERGTARWPGNPYIRPAQDRQYPQLTARIRARIG